MLLVLVPLTVEAFDISGASTWPSPTTTFYVDIPAPNSDPIWDDAFETAMRDWGTASIFDYKIVRGTFFDPCSDPNLVPVQNGVGFNFTACGDVWGSQTLAITVSWQDFASPNTQIQAGVVFNANESWSVYSGPFDFFVNDFRRVAVHELGHALGLGHEDGVAAIMSTFAGSVEVPQLDDITGVGVLYGDPDLDGIAVGSDNCTAIGNPSQTNPDNDNFGNLCDNDDDGDNVIDSLDAFPADPAYSNEIASAITVSVDAKTSGMFGNFESIPDTLNDMVTGYVFAGPGTIRISASDTIDMNPFNPLIQNTEPNGVLPVRRTKSFGSAGNYTPLEEKLVDVSGIGALSENLSNRGALFAAFVPKATVDTPGFEARDEDTVSVGIASSQLLFIGSGPFIFDAIQAGTLFFGVNDPIGNNNSGAYSVQIISTDDSDGDGTLDIDDNCPDDANADQLDTDSDDSGDVCDDDDDGDLLPDTYELDNGLDPLVSTDATADGDADGLTNLQEFQAGTDLNNPDSDNDGTSDGDEVATGRNPLLSEPAILIIINTILQEE